MDMDILKNKVYTLAASVFRIVQKDHLVNVDLNNFVFGFRLDIGWSSDRNEDFGNDLKEYFKDYSISETKLIDGIELFGKQLLKQNLNEYFQFFKDTINKYFIEEGFPYTYLNNNNIVDFLDDQQKITIEKAMSFSETVGKELTSSLKRLMENTQSNPTNIIEAIGMARNSMESCCKDILKKQGYENINDFSLGQLIPKLKEKIPELEPPMGTIFTSFYGFASQKGSHGKSELDNRLDKSDGKVAILMASIFVNYVFEKATKYNLNL